MKYSLLIKLNSMQKRYEDVLKEISDPNVIADQKRFRSLSKEYTELTNINHYFQLWKKNKNDLKKIKELLNDPEICDIAQIELKNIEENNNKLIKKLQTLLLLEDPNDKKNCYLEIRAGTGGSEATLFAYDLFKMYNKYAVLSHWTIDVINICENEYGGYKEIIAKISGDYAYGKLKFESGGHRVQRIPETESQGRIHTSTCKVIVLAEAPELEISKINPADLKIDTFRSSGAGGQHVNTTNSAIRITHIPSGIVVECQDERSQYKNKSKALSVLAARVYALELQKKHEIESAKRFDLLSSGSRSDRIRTYNFPKKRITDHRINLTLYNLDLVMNGNLDKVIQPIINHYKNR